MGKKHKPRQKELNHKVPTKIGKAVQANATKAMSEFLVGLAAQVTSVILFTVAFSLCLFFWKEKPVLALWLGFATWVMVGLFVALLVHQHLISASSKQPFVANVRTVFLAKDVHAFWVTYRSHFGDTASPVDVLLFLTITNMQSMDSTISAIRMEIDCGQRQWFFLRKWIGLRRIPSIGHSYYWAWGVENLKQAIPVEFGQYDLERSVFMKPIPAGKEVQGWIAYEVPETCQLQKAENLEYRITLADSKNFAASFTTKGPLEPKEFSGSDSIAASPMTLRGDARTDISKFHTKRYSEMPKD